MPFDIQQQIQSFLANPENVEALKRVGIGAGVGAAGMGLADAFTDDENRMPGGKTKSVLRSMLLGSALGGVGGAGYHAFQQASRPGGTAANGEEYYKGAIPKAYAKVRSAMGADESGQWTAERRGGAAGGAFGAIKSWREYANMARKDTGSKAMAANMAFDHKDVMNLKGTDPVKQQEAVAKIQKEIGKVLQAGNGKLAPEAQQGILKQLNMGGGNTTGPAISPEHFRQIMGPEGDRATTMGTLKAGVGNTFNHVMSKLTGGRFGKPFAPYQVQPGTVMDPWNSGRGYAPGLGSSATNPTGLAAGTYQNSNAKFAPSVAQNMYNGKVLSHAGANLARLGKPIGWATVGAGAGGAADWLAQRTTDQWLMNPAAKPFVK